jgi:hypothetical protein
MAAHHVVAFSVLAGVSLLVTEARADPPRWTTWTPYSGRSYTLSTPAAPVYDADDVDNVEAPPQPRPEVVVVVDSAPAPVVVPVVWAAPLWRFLPSRAGAAAARWRRQ